MDNYALTATVAGQGLVAPTGQVSFLDAGNGNAVLGTGTLVGNPSGYSFLNTQSPATGNLPDAVAIGDFNGDGLADVAVANNLDNTVTGVAGQRRRDLYGGNGDSFDRHHSSGHCRWRL